MKAGVEIAFLLGRHRRPRRGASALLDALSRVNSSISGGSCERLDAGSSPDMLSGLTEDLAVTNSKTPSILGQRWGTVHQKL